MTPRPHQAATQHHLEGSAPAPRIDQVIEALILSLLLYLPFAFGGVMPMSRVVITGVGALIAACFAVRCLSESASPVSTPRTMIPFAGLIALASVQLVTLPASVVETLSPTAGDLWSRAAEAAGAEWTSAPLSLYPYATAVQFDLLIMGGLLMLTAATVYRDRAAFKRLLLGVSVIGLLVALTGLGHLAFGEHAIYGVFEGNGARGAPFASYSHYSEFINLALGCALGYLLIGSSARVSGRTLDLRDLVGGTGRAPSRPEKLLIGFLVLGAVAVVLSTSRNGLIAMIFASAITAAAMQFSRRIDGIGWSIVGIGLIATAVLLALGIDPVIERFEATAADPSGAMSTRLDLIQDSASMGAAFAATGAGLGTYALSFPGFDTAVRSGTAEHAENQYLELFAEMGGGGALLGLAFLAVLFVRLFQRPRQSRKPSDLGLFGVLFGLSALAFHSLTDFGVVIPAVGLLAATLAGAALGRSSADCSASVVHRLACMGAGLLVLAALGTRVPAAIRGGEGWDQYSYAELIREEVAKAGGVGTPEQHAAMVQHTGLAREAEPLNAEVAFRAVLARWSLAVATARGFDLESPPVTPISHPDLSESAAAAVSDLRDILLLAPTHGPSWSAAGQLRRVWLEDKTEEAGEWILRGRALAPHHPAACLASAFELMRQDREAFGVAELERAVGVGAPRRDIVDLLAASLQRPMLALPFVEGDLDLTERLLSLVEAEGDQALLQEELEDRYENLLIAACARPGASERQLSRLATMERERGHLEEAANLLARVLSTNPASKSRYTYAKLLAETGDVRGARRELRDVLNFHPGMNQATRLLEQLEGDRSN
ncbi:MAG: O-antigen ligase family protein [Planctomycetota bacterium]|nr:O-antigen ligase family protein [Planctomycetota bacterium]